jgi:hypothetical protein
VSGVEWPLWLQENGGGANCQAVRLSSAGRLRCLPDVLPVRLLQGARRAACNRSEAPVERGPLTSRITLGTSTGPVCKGPAPLTARPASSCPSPVLADRGLHLSSSHPAALHWATSRAAPRGQRLDTHRTRCFAATASRQRLRASCSPCGLSFALNECSQRLAPCLAASRPGAQCCRA